MTAKVRKQIYIEIHQDADLKRLAKETGLSEAEIIRQAIDERVRPIPYPAPDLNAWAREKAFISSLMQQGTILGEGARRREDLHEE